MTCGVRRLLVAVYFLALTGYAAAELLHVLLRRGPADDYPKARAALPP